MLRPPCAGCKGLEYQRKVTGAPEGVEYRVEIPEDLLRRHKRTDPIIWIDGYEPGRNVWLEAKDWNNWPPLEGEFGKEKIDEALNALKLQAELAKRKGVGFEVHVPTERKAAELLKLLEKEGLDIDVVVTPR